MVENNNRKGRVRERLAYILVGGLVAYFFAKLAIGAAGIAIPEWVSTDLMQLGTIAGMVVAFFFGGEYGGQKPET